MEKLKEISAELSEKQTELDTLVGDVHEINSRNNQRRQRSDPHGESAQMRSRLSDLARLLGKQDDVKQFFEQVEAD